MSSTTLAEYFVTLWIKNIATLSFNRKKIASIILKCITLIIFYIPTLILTLISLIFALINVIMSKIPLLGLLFGIVTGLIAYITNQFYKLCNLFEIFYFNYKIDLYTKMRHYNQLEMVDEIIKENINKEN